MTLNKCGAVIAPSRKLYEYCHLTTNNNRYASIKKIGEDFGMSRSTIYRALHAGRFKAVKCGRLTRICVASVEQYFASLPQIACAMGAV